MEKLLETNRELDKIISTIGDLPSSPAIITTLIGLTSDINTDIGKISKTIMADQSLTAKLLKLSNSSFYGRAKEVVSLKEAIVLLGFQTLRSLVVATSTRSLYHGSVSAAAVDVLWEHSLATAIASRQIAEAIRHPQAEESFIAGLMHDIGKLIMLQKLDTEYKKIISQVEKNGDSFMELEDKTYGFNHTDVGLLILHKWSFPKILINAVFEHHHPIDNEESLPSLAYIVHLANHMAKSFGAGFGDYAVEDLIKLPSTVRLGLDGEQLETLQSRASERYVSEKDLYSA